MKRSTKYGILGFVLFFIGSLLIQMYIETIFFIGIVAMYLSFLLMDAKVNELEHERHVEEFDSLKEKIDESLEKMKDLNEESETAYYDNKINEDDFIKRSEQ